MVNRFGMISKVMIAAAASFTVVNPASHAATTAPSKTATSSQPSLSPLFSKGAETFRVQDKSGRTPTFRVLDDTPSEKALALAIITALNAQGEVQPKIPVRDHINLRVERLVFQPAQSNPDELELTLKLSGYDVEFSETISRSDFISGKPVEINFPKKEREVSFFSVESQGRLKLKWDAKANLVQIDNASAKINYNSPLAGSGGESLQFTGKAVRM